MHAIAAIFRTSRNGLDILLIKQNGKVIQHQLLNELSGKCVTRIR